MRTFPSPLTSFALVAALAGATLAVSCGDDDYTNQTPPGTGGFDPGTTIPGNGSSSGYGNGSGGSGGIPGPPMCDDSLKRCPHEFAYQGDGTETSVEVRGDFGVNTWNVGVPMTKSGNLWSVTTEIPYNASVQYKLVINGTTWIPDPANPNQVSDGFGGFNSVLNPTTCDPWTCAPSPALDEWADGVMYFVFTDRFRDGNAANNGNPTAGVQPPADWQGGDWAGVRQKITDGYFTDLGVNILWLSVPMDNTAQSGQGIGESYFYSGYHGYWPQNLDQTEEHFGSMAELQGLVSDAHTAGIKVILDYAMNHVHISSPVYQQHMGDGWFNNGNNCVCGQGCSWDPPQGEYCWFTSYLPDFNFGNAAARDFSVSNAIWWLQQSGADGFRLDAVKHINLQWLTDLRARVTSEVDAVSMKHTYMVGETFTGDRGLIASYMDPSTKLDGQFDFPLRNALVSSILLRQGNMQGLVNELNASDSAFANGLMSTFIGNHDVPRSIHFAQDVPVWTDPWAGGKDINWSNQPGLPGGTSAFQRMATAFTVIFTTKGIPLIYYGDEIGLPGAGDPDNRRFMNWNTGSYSQGQSLLLGHLQRLGQIRKDHPALRRGSRQTLTVGNDTLAYSMTGSGEVVYVAINRSDSSQQVGGLPSGQLTDLLTNTSVSGPTLTLQPRSSMILMQ